MKILIFNTTEELFDSLGEKLINEINNNPKIVLGLATGSTPVPLYHRFVKAYRNGLVSFKDVTTFNLDEYVELDIYEHSYHYFMKDHLFNHIDIQKANRHIPKSYQVSLEEEPIIYEKLLKEKPIDIQILGIGTNGHIGFNEPGTSFESTTMLVDLSKETIEDNKRFFENPNDVPKRAITMGIKSIMTSKEIILVATGDNKADAILKTVEGPVSTNVPASVLQTHPNVSIYLDKKAAKLLKK